MTAFYMFRLMFLTFFGETARRTSARGHAATSRRA